MLSSKMPKIRASSRSKLDSYVKLFGPETSSTDGRVLLCRICERQVVAERKSQVTQHPNGVKHKLEFEEKKGSASSAVVQMVPFLEASGKQSQFSIELCDAFLSADIPLHKLEHAKIEKFLEKWCRQDIPSATTLRKNYLEPVYENKIDAIRSSVAGRSIWISTDETTDVTGRFVSHTVVGTLETSGTESFLFYAESLEKTNHSTIAQAFMKSLTILWPNGIRHEKVLLFVSDGAEYMKKAGAALKVIFPKMLHITCAAHALHRVAEDCRSMFSDVDELIANGKKIFRKAAARVTLFKEIAPTTPLPPKPVLTR